MRSSGVLTLGDSPLVVAVLASGLHQRALVIWRTDLLYLRDVCRGREGTVWGGGGLHLLMGEGVMGVLDVVGTRPSGGATQS